MNKIVAVTVVALGIALGANAQAQKKKQSPEQRTEMQMQWMKKNLALNESQSKKMHDIILKYATKRDSIVGDKPEPATRPMVFELMKKREEEVRTILNNDQFAKFQVHQQEMMGRMRESAPEGAGGK